MAFDVSSLFTQNYYEFIQTQSHRLMNFILTSCPVTIFLGIIFWIYYSVYLILVQNKPGIKSNYLSWMTSCLNKKKSYYIIN